ncbi:hypothetical protein C4552_03525 [Candidatus Parcubacteria bacterium]|nr:MAG: hypothetical protein C4552_03525 [Candidatus Parcubacteria bacterium]
MAAMGFRRKNGILVVAMAAILAAAFVLVRLSREQAPPPVASLAGSDQEEPSGCGLPDTPPEQGPLSKYVEIIDSCGPDFEGACVNARTRPDTSAPVAARLRTGIVLKISDTVVGDGRSWYRIAFDEAIRYPERITSEWYITSEHAHLIEIRGVEELLGDAVITTEKEIIVDLSEQKLYAYERDALIAEEYVSTGVPEAPTPRGPFRIYKKMPSRYMQGPLPGISDQYFDLPGVPWNLYFTEQGGAIHGTYWHDQFGKRWSHGCVNLPVGAAKTLYEWADLGTRVIVRD